MSSAQTTAGQDGGDYWAVAVGYKQGPWGVSVFYSLGERDWGSNGSPSTGVEESVERWGIGGHYSVAPGWQIRADYNYIEHENIGGVAQSAAPAGTLADNEVNAFILTNRFSF